MKDVVRGLESRVRNSTAKIYAASDRGHWGVGAHMNYLDTHSPKRGLMPNSPPNYGKFFPRCRDFSPAVTFQKLH